MLKILPEIIKGNRHIDLRGTLLFNNSFDVSGIKRIYIIEYQSLSVFRAWQGHKIEQRWFSVVKGVFEI